jgi:hypothetical protein
MRPVSLCYQSHILCGEKACQPISSVETCTILNKIFASQIQQLVFTEVQNVFHRVQNSVQKTISKLRYESLQKSTVNTLLHGK